MKTTSTLLRFTWVKFSVILSLFLVFSCNHPAPEDIQSSYTDSNGHNDDWITLLDELYDGTGIIVQKGNSIQDALNVAEPGGRIYIEPGLYRELITVDKPDIKLIGLKNAWGETVALEDTGDAKEKIQVTGKGTGVEIINIRHEKDEGKKPAQASRNKRTFEKSHQLIRKEIGGGIVHYQFEIRVGKRPFDVVRIHRVVREQKKHQPVRTRGAVFMAHGASLKFEAIFLKAGSQLVNAGTSVGYYLADKNIDVWGMDFGWTLVQAETSDFEFMKDWGVNRDVEHTLAAMSVARLIRGLTGQGFGRLNLLGYSYGVMVAYSAAGIETQQHPILRSINGVIAVDQGLKYAASDEAFRIAACNGAAASKQQINNGVYRLNNGQVFAGFAGLAVSAPDDSSPFIPNLTNYQAALFIGTSTFAQGNAAAPFWHFVCGVFDDPAIPIPSGLAYTEPARWIGLLASLPPYQPQLTTYEVRACMCDEEDVTIDDHLSEISLPILYIGAGGAIGTLGDYTSTLTSSSDITNYTVNLKPADQRLTDYGHGDLFLADNAPDLVWNVLYRWLVSHNSRSVM